MCPSQSCSGSSSCSPAAQHPRRLTEHHASVRIAAVCCRLRPADWQPDFLFDASSRCKASWSPSQPLHKAGKHGRRPSLAQTPGPRLLENRQSSLVVNHCRIISSRASVQGARPRRRGCWATAPRGPCCASWKLSAHATPPGSNSRYFQGPGILPGVVNLTIFGGSDLFVRVHGSTRAAA